MAEGGALGFAQSRRRISPRIARAVDAVRGKARKVAGTAAARRAAIGARMLMVTAVALVAGNIAALQFGRTEGRVGPATIEVSHDLLGSAFRGGQVVGDVEPAGTVRFEDIFTSPLHTELRIRGIDQTEALLLRDDFASQATAQDLEDRLLGQARSLLIRSAIVSTAWFVVGAAVGALAALGVLALLSRRLVGHVRRRRAWQGVGALTGTALLLSLAVFGSAAATLRPDGLARPQLTGYLTQADTLLRATGTSLSDYQDHSKRLSSWINQLAETQRQFTQFSTRPADDGLLRFLVISDVHSRPCTYDRVRTIAQVFGVAFVINSGDETEWGSNLESSLLTGDSCAPRSRPSYLTDADGNPIPVYQVKGNHDSAATMATLAAESNVTVLDHSGATVTATVQNAEVEVSIYGIGDTRFTPDDGLVGKKEGDSGSLGGRGLAAGRDVAQANANIVVTHDPLAFAEMDKAYPSCFSDASLLIAGHTHQEDTSKRIEGVPLLVNGTTGGGGLRTAEGGDSGQASVMTVVYMDPSSKAIVRYGVVSVDNDGSFSYTVTLPSDAKENA
ncbi:MAG: Metallophosphoesterase [Pseudonocardiales bacterium]|nr:Metallophosphoesterase [Pseudonocardiales bacterium]